MMLRAAEKRPAAVSVRQYRSLFENRQNAGLRRIFLPGQGDFIVQTLEEALIKCARGALWIFFVTASL